MKVCSKCSEEKPTEAFSRCSRAKDGLRSSCRLCNQTAHRARLQASASPCVDCGEPTSRAGQKRCKTCSNKYRSGPKHYAYKDGRSLTPSGYVYLSGHQGHPNANGVGQIAEHVLVMAQKIGRPLLKGENVHHLNGQRDDNRPENLELWSKVQPAGQRVEDKVAWAIEILKLYKPEILKEES